MQQTRFMLCVVVIFVVQVVLAWRGNQAQNVGIDVPSGKLRSLSFAPYHEGFSPIDKKFPLREHIASDLALLADKTYIVRTYSVRGGMQPTPELARKHGLEMLMGGWLGDGADENHQEIAELIKTANANPDVVKRVIVGNEVLLRKDMGVDTLIDHIRKVKKAVKQPVTYADVWSSYLQYPQLFAEVDFITIHILPYWEDKPVAVDQAAEHVETIVRRVQDKARSLGYDKPILIGESGWPGRGRQRGEAVPGVVNQARFIRSLVQVANRHGFDYNIVEAFNQPWKSHHEGVVGAHWGLFDSQRQAVFPLMGPVQENPDWRTHTTLAAGFWFGLVAMGYSAVKNLALTRLLLWLTLANLFAVGLVETAVSMWHSSYNDGQRLYSATMIVANATMAGLLLYRVFMILSGRTESGNALSLFSATLRAELMKLPFNWSTPLVSVRAALLNWRTGQLAWALRLGYLLFGGLAVIKTWRLAIDGRYLSFPSHEFLIPAIGIAGLWLALWLAYRREPWRNGSIARMTDTDSICPHERWLAGLLILGAPAVIVGETWSFLSAYDFKQAHPDIAEGWKIALGYALGNQQLLIWLVCVVVLALPFYLPRLADTRSQSS